MMSTWEINVLIFKQLHLNKSFSETMSYFDKRDDVPESMQEVLFALETVQKIVNVREQFSEETIRGVIQTLKEKQYDVNSLQRVIKRLQQKYMD